MVASYMVSNLVTFFSFPVLKGEDKVYEQNGTKLLQKMILYLWLSLLPQ